MFSPQVTDDTSNHPVQAVQISPPNPTVCFLSDCSAADPAVAESASSDGTGDRTSPHILSFSWNPRCPTETSLDVFSSPARFKGSQVPHCNDLFLIDPSLIFRKISNLLRIVFSHTRPRPSRPPATFLTFRTASASHTRR